MRIYNLRRLKMIELREIISELENRERICQNDLKNTKDDEQGQKAIDELNMVRNQLSEKRHELQQLQRAEQIEEKVQAEAIPFAVAGVDFTGLPDEVITLVDEV